MVFTVNLSVNPKCSNSTPFLDYMNSTGRRVQWSSFVCCSLSASSIEEGFSARERLDRDRSRRCLCFDLHNEVVPYKRAWLFQKFLVERRRALTEKDEDHADTVIILQHCPVYTLGTNSTEEYLNFEMKDAPFDIFRTERGGEVTYHGPGQLVMYPILNLRYHKMDLHWYLRSLEEVVIRVLESSFSIKATRQNGLTGECVTILSSTDIPGNEKVAAVGIRVTRWITYHGLALNVNTDLSPFQHIVPCGIRDRQVGSIEGILKRSGCEQTGVEDLIEIVHKSLLKEFSEVFQLSLQFKSTSDTSTEDSGLVATR